ncbi:MAG TPA: DUF4136 domain-containing protein [Thermodesulfovibrionales bacterium]|nr:DUF4136 domain-containing protein [Thermodesulfovibrionales bacterium]
MMNVFKGERTLALIATVLVSVLIMAGCATSIKYSYDARTSFSEQKNYAWGPSSGLYSRDPLLEANVQVFADQLLAQKGFTRTSDKADLLISMSYEFDTGIYQYNYNYELRMLTLNIYKIRNDVPLGSEMSKMSMHREISTENKELVWRGTAYGTINSDAASKDLKQAVQEILSNFPPK